MEQQSLHKQIYSISMLLVNQNLLK